jgi:hypothetical protein
MLDNRSRHKIGDLVMCSDLVYNDDGEYIKVYVLGAITTLSQEENWIQVQWSDENHTFTYDDDEGHDPWGTVDEYKLLLKQKLQEAENELQEVHD